MARLGKNIKAKEYRYFTHCFMSMGKSYGIPEYDTANDEILQTIKELFN